MSTSMTQEWSFLKRATSRYWATVLCDPLEVSSSISTTSSTTTTTVNNTVEQTSPRLPPRRIISKTSRQFGCVRCGARFERRGHLQSHIDTVHDRKRPFSCPRGCGKVFGHRSSLSRHIRTAHERTNKVDGVGVGGVGAFVLQPTFHLS